MNITEESIRIVRLALYQLRQDVGVPATVEDAKEDTSLTWTKCRDALEVAFEEVLNAHNWTWKRGADGMAQSPDDWPADAKNALVYCLARELAVPVAGRVEDLKNCKSLYEDKLQDARVHDLYAELEAVEDPDMKEVLAAVCPAIVTGGAALPMDLVSVTRRVEANRAHAMSEILAAHNWSFARAEFRVCSCSCSPIDGNYPFLCELPPKCVRPLACYARGGEPADWKIVGQVIRSVEPVETILYLRNEERLDKWPPLCRAAFVSLLAAEVAATVAGSSAEANRLRQVFERDLETAKLADSRGTGSRREPKGRNFYAEAMLGGRGRRAREDWPWR